MFLFGLLWLSAGLKPWKGWSSPSSSTSVSPLLEYSDMGSVLDAQGNGSGESLVLDWGPVWRRVTAGPPNLDNCVQRLNLQTATAEK